MRGKYLNPVFTLYRNFFCLARLQHIQKTWWFTEFKTHHQYQQKQQQQQQQQKEKIN